MLASSCLVSSRLTLTLFKSSLYFSSTVSTIKLITYQLTALTLNSYQFTAAPPAVHRLPLLLLVTSISVKLGGTSSMDPPGNWIGSAVQFSGQSMEPTGASRFQFFRTGENCPSKPYSPLLFIFSKWIINEFTLNYMGHKWVKHGC